MGLSSRLTLARFAASAVTLHSVGLVIDPFVPDESVSAVWSRVCGIALRAAGLPLRVDDPDGLLARPARVIVANHVNMVDGYTLRAAIPGPMTALHHERWLRVPVYGRHVRRMGAVAFDNEDPKAGVRALLAARTALRGGRSVLVFPEGKRSEDGALGPFEAGACVVARAAGVDVTVVAQLDAVARMHPPTGRWSTGPQRIRVLGSISADDLRRRGARWATDEARTRIAHALGAG